MSRSKSLLPLLAAVLAAVVASSPAGAQTAVQFDGTNDHVAFGAAPSLGVSTFTVETWFRRTGTGATASTGTGGVTAAIPLLTKGRGEAEASNVDMNWFLGIRGSDSVLVADYEEGTGQTSPGLNHPIVGVTPVRSHVWYHAAATFDGTTLRLYLNGNLEATVAVGAGRLPQSASIQHAALGTAMTSTGATQGFFAGALDEPRVWNVARTQPEIQSGLLGPIATATGLVGRWALDEGAAATAASTVGGAPSGALIGGAAWGAGSPFALQYGLFLAGAAGHVTFGTNAALGLPQFTIETWFRRDGAGATTTTGAGGVTDAIPLVTKGRGESEGSNVDLNWFLGLRAADGVLIADFEEGAAGSSPGLNHPVIGATPVLAGSGWHHGAATYDGTTWRLYLDGRLEATLAVGQPPQSASIQHAAIGSALNSTGVAAGFFHGAIDEARVWSAARSIDDLRTTINTALTGGHPGLVARWGLDEAAGTSAANSAGGAVTGTLTGAGVSWTQGAPFHLQVTPPDDPTGLSALATAHDAADLTWTDGSDDETGFEVERSFSGPGGPFAPVATLPAGTTSWTDRPLTPSTEYCWRVRAINALGGSGWTATQCATTAPPANLAIDFTGSSYVSLGLAPELNAATFTVECWFRRDGEGVTTTTGTEGVTDAIPLVTKGRGESEASNVDLNWFLGLRQGDDVLIADFEEGAAGLDPSKNHPVAGVTPILPGSGWHHAAVTYDGTNWNLYLDGCLETTLAVGQPPASASTQHAAIGSALRSDASAAGFFDGAIDEARVWSLARTGAEIRAGMMAPLESAEAGLLGRWSLDESGGTAAAATTGPAGTLIGTATHGPGATYGDPLGPQTLVLAPNGGESLVPGTTVSLQWSASDCFGVSSVDLLLSRDGNAGPWETIASGIANTGSHPWLVAGAPTSIGVLRVVAHDAAGHAAEDLSDSPFSVTEPPVPALIALFELVPGAEGIEVRWAFADPSFVAATSLQRRDDASDSWTVVGAPITERGTMRMAMDREATPGLRWWYRLEVTDTRGDRITFGPISAIAETIAEFALGAATPNPAAGPVSLGFALPVEARVTMRLHDLQGRTVITLADGTFRAGLHRLAWNGETSRGRIAPGVYFVRAEMGGRSFTRRLVIAR